MATEQADAICSHHRRKMSLCDVVAVFSYNTARNVITSSFLEDRLAICSWPAVPLLGITLRKTSHVCAKPYAQE